MKAISPRPSGTVDWSAIRARLKQAEFAAEEAMDPPPARATAIMDARAAALARVPEQPQAPGSELDVVEFSLGKERYAIEARFVREVVTFVGYTPIPRAPEILVGVTNLRGLVLPVVDLRRLFNVGAGGLPDQSRVIVLGLEEAEFGILADETHGPTRLAADELRAAPSEAPGMENSLLRGMTAGAVAILDGAKLIADERLFHHDSR